MSFGTVADVSVLLALSRSFLSRAQVLTVHTPVLCSEGPGMSGGLSVDEVQCRAQTKTLPDLCWVGAGVPCHLIHVVLLQAGDKRALDRLNGAVCPAGTLGEEREEAGAAGQGTQSILGLARHQQLWWIPGESQRRTLWHKGGSIFP